MNINPANILNLENYGLNEGTTANMIVFDPEREWKVNSELFKSKGKNTPFDGQNLLGKNILTLVDGEIVFDDRGDQSEILYR
mgnify:FL=1